MELDEINKKKKHGDTSRIQSIVNAKRKEMGSKPYSETTIRSMLNGTRTMKDEVKQAAEIYYSILS